MVVVWVQYFGQFFCVDVLLFGVQEIVIVEFGQVEWMSVFGLLQMQWLGDVVVIVKYWQVSGFVGNDECWLLFVVFVDFFVDIYLDIQCFVMMELWVVVVFLVVRGFYLLVIVK